MIICLEYERLSTAGRPSLYSVTLLCAVYCSYVASSFLLLSPAAAGSSVLLAASACCCYCGRLAEAGWRGLAGWLRWLREVISELVTYAMSLSSPSILSLLDRNMSFVSV